MRGSLRIRLPWPRRLVARAAATTALVAAADALFFRRGVGVSAAVFGLLAAAAIAATAAPGLGRRVTLGSLLGVVLTLLILVEEPTPLGLVLAAGALVLFATETRQGPVAGLRGTAGRLLAFPLVGAVQPLKDGRVLVRATALERSVGGAGGLVRRWAFPLLLAGVFLVLLLAGNAILARWARSWGEGAMRFLADVDRVRVAFWMVTAIVAWALIRTRIPLSPASSDDRAHGPAAPDAGFLVRSLALFNVLFLVPNAIDVRYLWLGGDLPEGLTYAQYAHRGAYPLLAAALLSAGFVLATFREGTERAVGAWPRRLVHLFLAQNVFLTLGAAERLRLYVGAYDLTRFRFAAAVWMLLVAVGLVLIVVRIATGRSNAWLVVANVRTALAALLLCAAMNVDGLIADHNVAGAREMGGDGQPIDLRYLDELGEDALPALERLAREARAPDVRDRAARRALRLREVLDRDLADPRTWTMRRARLASSPSE